MSHPDKKNKTSTEKNLNIFIVYKPLEHLITSFLMKHFKDSLKLSILES